MIGSTRSRSKADEPRFAKRDAGRYAGPARYGRRQLATSRGPSAQPAVVVEQLTKRFGEPRRVRGCLVRGRLRRGVRLPRPERGGEDHDRADARHAARADLGVGDDRRHRR